MSGALRTVGKVAGTIASVAALIPGPHQPFAAAAAVAINSTLAITATGPLPQGQISDRILGANNPQPYMIGRTYSGGVQVHDIGWGGEVNDVQNPYRFLAAVHSCCGPVKKLVALQFDYETITFSETADASGAYPATGYYADYVWLDTQLGTRPETSELKPNWSGTPDWGSTYKLSSHAALGLSLLWSKKGKRFAGGRIPIIGAIWKGVKVYDPRLDSTFAGGSGSHRIDDETTWEYDNNPALHALAYAYGRYVNGVKVFGVDLGEAGIDVAQVVAWANVCDTNDWTVNGTIYEPENKWNNLKRICEAGAAQPFLEGGVLSFDYQALRTSLYTITKDDLAAGGVSSTLGKGWKNRHNTLVPRFRSETHQWNYVQADEVEIAAAVTADGETKTAERQWDLVTDKDQVTELAIYDLYQRREAGPFEVVCKSHMVDYGPGDCLTLHADLGAHPDGAVKCVVRSRVIDPVSATVTLRLEQDTDAKHTAAVGAVGGEPSTITFPTSEELDTAAALNNRPAGYLPLAIAGSYTTGLAGSISQADSGASSVTVTIPTHTRRYGGGFDDVTVTGDDIDIPYSKTALIYYDDSDPSDGLPTYGHIVPGEGGDVTADAYYSEANPSRHFVARVTTQDSGGAGGSEGGSGPPGSGGWSGTPGEEIP